MFSMFSDRTNGNPLPAFSAKHHDGKPRRNFDPYYTGQTIISDTGWPMRVCVAANADAFKADLVRTVNR
jgi:hypothetical protein